MEKICDIHNAKIPSINNKYVTCMLYTIYLLLYSFSSIYYFDNAFEFDCILSKELLSIFVIELSIITGTITLIITLILRPNRKIHIKIPQFPHAIIISAIIIPLIFYAILHISIRETFTSLSINGISSCVAFVIPLCLTVKMFRQYKVLTMMLLGGAIMLVLYLQSRTGILCVSTLLLLYFYYRRRCSGYRSIFLGILFVVFLCYLFIYKYDSSNGRLLIWRCTLGMIWLKPFIGYGSHGFVQNYMNYQADYFSVHPKDEWAILADNAHHPLNEYLLLFVDYGLIGFLIVVAIIFVIVYLFKKRSDNTLCQGAFASIVMILIYSCFSYPLRYPFTWFIMVYDIYLLFRVLLNNKNIQIKRSTLSLLTACVLFMSCCFICQTIYDIHTQVRWKKLFIRAQYGHGNNLSAFCDLEKDLHNNHLYMFNLASELYLHKRTELGLQKAIQCEQLCPSYDISLLKGYMFEELERYQEAIDAYSRAHNMCPARFRPLYQLAMLYYKMKDFRMARHYGIIIQQKAIKIPSVEIDNMIKRINKTIFEEEDNFKVPDN